jgi:anthranilate phosphoribosyltransferase
VHPADLGIPKASPEALRGGDAAENARIARDVLDGSRGAPRDIVLLNAGVSLLVAGVVPDIAQGISRATSALDSGAAAGALRQLIELSNTAPEAA